MGCGVSWRASLVRAVSHTLRPVQQYERAERTALRILRVSDSPTSLTPDHRSAVGRGGHRIDASRNLWAAAGFKVESVTTDAVWGRGSAFI